MAEPLEESKYQLTLHGFEETQPTREGCDNNLYFPLAAQRNHRHKTKPSNSEGLIIAVTVPCYNEKASALRMTLEAFVEQDVSSNCRLEIVIVMDGVMQMSSCMRLYLRELFRIPRDETSDPFFGTFHNSVNTVIVEPRFCHTRNEDYSKRTQTKGNKNGPSIHLSLVVKRYNQKKVNSQMWALAAHAKACYCDFALLTDCGTAFDKNCLRYLLTPMLKDETIGVATGYQNCMSASMQGCGADEWRKNPSNFFLRQAQIFDFDVYFAVSKSFYSMIGFLPVIPGPCGLYRYKLIGSLKEGVMKEYFDLSCRKLTNSDLVLGNTQLAEDRFPGNLLTLQTKEECERQGLSQCPSVKYVADAIYNNEAEIPLGPLVKQRRRWNNGSFFAAVWFLSADWLWKSNNSVFFKFLIYLTSGCESILAPVVSVLLTPPTIACSIFGATNGYFGGNFALSFAIQHDINLKQSLISLIPSTLYMAVYAAFILGHIPRAVKVKQVENEDQDHDVEKGFWLMFSRSSADAQWRGDRRSAFRPLLWKLAFLANFLAFLFVIPWIVVSFIYHLKTMPMIRCLLGMAFAVLVAALINSFCGYRKPNFKPFLSVATRLPLMLFSGGFVSMIWVQCYSFTRISDLTWGNREGAHDDTATSTIAQQRARTGKLVAYTMLCSHFILYSSFCYWILHDVQSILYIVTATMAPSTILISLHTISSFLLGGKVLVNWIMTRDGDSSAIGEKGDEREDDGKESETPVRETSQNAPQCTESSDHNVVQEPDRDGKEPMFSPSLFGQSFAGTGNDDSFCISDEDRSCCNGWEARGHDRSPESSSNNSVSSILEHRCPDDSVVRESPVGQQGWITWYL